MYSFSPPAHSIGCWEAALVAVGRGLRNPVTELQAGAQGCSVRLGQSEECLFRGQSWCSGVGSLGFGFLFYLGLGEDSSQRGASG